LNEKGGSECKRLFDCEKETKVLTYLWIIEEISPLFSASRGRKRGEQGRRVISAQGEGGERKGLGALLVNKKKKGQVNPKLSPQRGEEKQIFLARIGGRDEKILTV